MKPKYKNNTNFSQVIPAGKLYFSIGEVAELLDINTSTIRFWDEELSFNLQKNSRNERRFKPEDIENLQIIIHLKEKGLNINGIKAELKNNKIELKHRLQAIKSLQNIVGFFKMLKNELKDDDQSGYQNDSNEKYSFDKLEEKYINNDANEAKNEDENHSVDMEEMYSPEYLEEYQQHLVEESNEEK